MTSSASTVLAVRQDGPNLDLLTQVLSQSLRRGRAPQDVSRRDVPRHGAPWTPGEWHPGFWLGLDLKPPTTLRGLLRPAPVPAALAEIRRAGLLFVPLMVTGPGRWEQFVEPDLLLVAAEGRVAALFGEAGAAVRDRFQAWDRSHRSVNWAGPAGAPGGVDLLGWLAEDFGGRPARHDRLATALLGDYAEPDDKTNRRPDPSPEHVRLVSLLQDASAQHRSLTRLGQALAAEEHAALQALGAEMQRPEWDRAFGSGERLRRTLGTPGLLELNFEAAPLVARRVLTSLYNAELGALAETLPAGRLVVPVTTYHQVWSFVEHAWMQHALSTHRAIGALSVGVDETPERLVDALCGEVWTDARRLAVREALLMLHLRCTSPGHAVLEQFGSAAHFIRHGQKEVPDLPLLTPPVTQQTVEWMGQQRPNPLAQLI